MCARMTKRWLSHKRHLIGYTDTGKNQFLLYESTVWTHCIVNRFRRPFLSFNNTRIPFLWLVRSCQLAFMILPAIGPANCMLPVLYPPLYVASLYVWFRSYWGLSIHPFVVNCSSFVSISCRRAEEGLSFVMESAGLQVPSIHRISWISRCS